MTSPDPVSTHKTDFEDLVEDIFGMNFRSLRTIRDLVLHPAQVSTVYASGDRETYTPAVRVFLCLIAIQIFASFFTGGHAAIALAAFEEQPRSGLDVFLGTAGAEEAIFRDRLETFARIYGEFVSIWQAPTAGLFVSLSLFLIRPVEEPLSWVRRLNITFAIISVGSTFALLTMPLIKYAPDLMIWVTPGIAVIYFITYLRGSGSLLAKTHLGRVLRGLLFSLVSMALLLLAGILLGMIGTIVAILNMPPL